MVFFTAWGTRNLDVEEAALAFFFEKIDRRLDVHWTDEKGRVDASFALDLDVAEV